MKILVTFTTEPRQRQWLEEFFKSKAEIDFLEDYPSERRSDIISEGEILLAWNPEKEGLYDSDDNLFRNIQFIQLLSAGYDHINLDIFPKKIKIAANQGAYAEPMAEHSVAMLLALSKKLWIYHNEMSKGAFKQTESVTKSIKGSVLGIVGFGSIGKRTADLLRPFGVKIMAINTSGKTTEEVEFVGVLKDLDFVLKNSDMLLLSCPLTEETNNLITKQKLELMKDDAVLINVARGPIINQKDLYDHLSAHPNFYAGIDAWWVEPFKYGKFEIEYPFFELPNLLGSPHNSAMVKDSIKLGTEKAAYNVERFLNREGIEGLIN
ncbi:MAG: 2-hydroxyacid dehydrogenase [Weeksellaceae bacterium]|nr:2-hydroxyacid dehydrogenase [Weeksellaceae bacterium]